MPRHFTRDAEQVNGRPRALAGAKRIEFYSLGGASDKLHIVCALALILEQLPLLKLDCCALQHLRKTVLAGKIY